MSHDNDCLWCYGQRIRKSGYQEPSYEQYGGNQRDKCGGCGCWNGCDESDQGAEHRKRESESVNIVTSVKIIQRGEANGGDANGGDGGNAKGGSAAAASANSEGDGDAGASACICGNHKRCHSRERSGRLSPEREQEKEKKQQEKQELQQQLESLLDITGAIAIGESAAIGGWAAGGDGGNGGVGGNGGTIAQAASVTVENVVVITSENGHAPMLTLGTNERKLDIKVDENGNTFVNGQKMDEQELQDGTRVFIFRNSETKNSETK